MNRAFGGLRQLGKLAKHALSPPWVCCSLVVLLGSWASPALGNFRVGGFGTVGYSVLLESTTKDGGQLEEYSGVSSKGTLRNLTRFGLNISKDITENAMLALQVVANGADLFHGTENDHQFKVSANLAALRYEYEAYTFLVGLIPTANFIISDLIQVGYSYLYAQPPKGYYRFADTETLTGLRATRYFEMGDLYTNVIVTLGEVLYNKTVEDQSTYDTDSSFTYSLHLENEYRNHFFRVGYILFPSFRHSRTFKRIATVGGNTIELESVGSCIDSDMQATGFAYRGTFFEDFQVLGELAVREVELGRCRGVLERTEKAVQTDWSSYISLSYQLGRFTPRVGFTDFKRSIDTAEATAFATRNVPDGPVREATRQAIDKELQDLVAQQGSSYSLGLNYQISSQIILKTEIEHHEATEDDINGYYMPPKSTATVLNVSLDYVF